MPTIWGRYENQPIERIDSCAKKDVDYMLYNYKLAFGALPGQCAYGRWCIWAGLKRDCPKGSKK